jgi:type IV secretory pathway TrbL component
MFTIFARLHADEPVGTELLASTRRRWPRPGNAMYAIVLIPVLFAAIIIGALLGGSARSPATCDAGYSVGGSGPPLASAISCPMSGKATSARAVSGKTTSATVSASRALAASASCPAGSAVGSVSATRFTTMTGVDQAFSPSARAETTTADLPGMC